MCCARKNFDLQSLGHAAATYQRDPREIAAALGVIQAERAAAENRPIPHEAKPALILNDVPYFGTDEIVLAIGWLAQRDAEKSREKAGAIHG